ncbi:DUF4179 domain-containing protein [Caldibacillus lycopersici]|uniref:DUF4179 domain-containing protein n=1 Tax=Perspicuibacillus lycopersici TaxID=1325689 RepID=A0AAE3IUW8_9BACI|nr:DUF4179 domain-containing protein [Perspicuibacillus lycopersici]MCU9615038.1 DUF4179 domain-containing protein [Perspicuibacillus lycopersici]
MGNKEEEQLTEAKNKFAEIPIPETIDNYIYAGIQKATNYRRKGRRTFYSAIAVAALLFFSVISIRISPVFASIVRQIPGFERLVSVIQGDKGLESAVANDYVQVVGKSQTKQGITFTVDEIIVDEQRLFIFYSITTEENYDSIIASKVEITNQDGEDIVGTLANGAHIDVVAGETVKGKMDVGFLDGVDIPDELNLNLSFQANEIDNKETWNIHFLVDKEKFSANKETFPLNKTVTVEGQKLTFQEVTIYPTRIAIHVKYDEANTKELFSFDDLVILNEDGEEWASVKNGVSGTTINANEEMLYLESNYFEKPEELYLQFSSIRALDKDQMEVVVDLTKEQLIKKPEELLSLSKVVKEKDIVRLTFSIKQTNAFDTNQFYEIFNNRYFDHDGNEYSLGGSSSYRSSELGFMTEISVKNVVNASPLYLEISDFPSRIEQKTTIKIK